MKKKFAAFLREENSLRELRVTDADKPPIDQTFMKRWQSVFDLVTMDPSTPAVLILRVTQDQLGVLFKSSGTDQITIDYYLKNGFYCASVLGKTGLLIEARSPGEAQADVSMDIPSVKACFGLPILWPDETLFGVVCMLNHSENALKPFYRNVLSGFMAMLEQELALLVNQPQPQPAAKPGAMRAMDNQSFEQELKQLNEQRQLMTMHDIDALTSVYSRLKIEDILKHEFGRAKRYFKTFSVMMIAINGIEQINDTLGSEAGDDVLKAFAKSIGGKVRETDSLGRWESDVFIIVCPYTDTVEIQQMIARVKPLVSREMKAKEAFSDFSFGVSQYEPDDLTYQAIVSRARENMNQYIEMLKRKSAMEAGGENLSSR